MEQPVLQAPLDPKARLEPPDIPVTRELLVPKDPQGAPVFLDQLEQKDMTEQKERMDLQVLLDPLVLRALRDTTERMDLLDRLVLLGHMGTPE